MRRTRQNSVIEDQMPGDYEFRQFIVAAQDDLIGIGESFQGERSAFPAVPDGGGFLATPKGMYEGILTDDATPLPKWRRLSDGVLYDPGNTIPVTL